MNKHWTLDDIPWDRFDRSLADDGTIKVIKAAALTEYNARHYTTYLRNIFHADAAFQQIALVWAEEEVQHGLALGRWSELADPGYDFEQAFKKFTTGYVIPVDKDKSIRGCLQSELLARCLVETGTSSMYSAIADHTDEPVLKLLCRKIAADEFRHYKLFYTYMQKVPEPEKASLLARVKVAVGRLREVDDDELAFAFHCANEKDQPYDLQRCNNAYSRQAFSYYGRYHIERAVGMIFKAVGLKPHSWMSSLASTYAEKVMQGRVAA
ncbi:MAG: ferritin-like domain-containing protein [Alphaproteobacteria bacterium]|nr:ferritin-like domain-containing protein [Alphaproteobacteria bacterium]